MDKKLVVITGASSGFGKEMAQLFGADGYPMLLLARHPEKLDASAFDAEKTMIEAADVADRQAFEAAVRKAEEKFGKTDLLVNNAGVMLLGNVWKQDPKEWEQMLNTNVMGVLNGMQIVLNDMKERKSGTIINMSSIAGKKTFGNHAAYVATKFGVHGMTETVREEVSGDNVRVLLMAPGAAETKLLTHVTDQDALTAYNGWKEDMGGVTLDPKVVAGLVKTIYEMPQEVSIREIDIAATAQDA